MWKQLLNVEHDKFTQTSTCSTPWFLWNECWFRIKYQSTPEGEHLIVDCSYDDRKILDIDKGNLIINLNNTKNIVLSPATSNWDFHENNVNGQINFNESISCELTKDQLLDICNAKSIDYQLRGKNGIAQRKSFVDIEILKQGYPGWQMMQVCAKAMYNQVYDHSVFIEDIEEAKKKPEEYAKKDKELAAKKAEAAKSQGGCLSTILLLLTPTILGIGYVIYNIFA